MSDHGISTRRAVAIGAALLLATVYVIAMWISIAAMLSQEGWSW